MLGTELTPHLYDEAGAEPPPEEINRRNGLPTVWIKGSDVELPLQVPRNRQGKHLTGPSPGAAIEHPRLIAGRMHSAN
jgi:hypothetical protein